MKWWEWSDANRACDFLTKNRGLNSFEVLEVGETIQPQLDQVEVFLIVYWLLTISTLQMSKSLHVKCFTCPRLVINCVGDSFYH